MGVWYGVCMLKRVRTTRQPLPGGAATIWMTWLQRRSLASSRRDDVASMLMSRVDFQHPEETRGLRWEWIDSELGRVRGRGGASRERAARAVAFTRGLGIPFSRTLTTMRSMRTALRNRGQNRWRK